MLRGVWVPCWRDVTGLAAPPFEAQGADSVSWITVVVSWLLRGVCEIARHRGVQPEHTHSQPELRVFAEHRGGGGGRQRASGEAQREKKITRNSEI